MRVFTIGHSNYPFEKLVQMLRDYNINCVVDIRETPYSKYNVQYNKEDLCRSLKKEGFTYVYMGHEFGARRGNKESYTEEGYANFEKVAKEESFLRGIKRLEKGCEMGFNIVLLGAMQDPIRCHRSILLGKELIKYGFDVKHILHEGNLADKDFIEECLLEKYFSDRNQLSIDNLLGVGRSKEEMIEEGYRLANKDIGYRTESIGKDK